MTNILKRFKAKKTPSSPPEARRIDTIAMSVHMSDGEVLNYLLQNPEGSFTVDLKLNEPTRISMDMQDSGPSIGREK